MLYLNVFIYYLRHTRISKFCCVSNAADEQWKMDKAKPVGH